MYHLHWLPIDKRIDFKVLIFVHKIIHKCHVPDYLNHLVEIQPDRYRKRSVNAFKAVTVQSKNSYGDRAFCIRGPKLWKKLPQTLREISDHKLFRKELKTLFFSMCYGQPVFRN